MVSELAQISAKVLVTGLLLLLTLLLVREIWRIWFDDSLTLVQFEYFGGEKIDREVGQHFTQLVRQDLSRLATQYHRRTQPQESNSTGSANAALDDDNDSAPGVLLLSPVANATVTLPELDQSVWSSVGTEVYGVPVARLVSDFYNWVRRPAHIKGRVSRQENGYHVYAELSNAPRSIRQRLSGAVGFKNWQFTAAGGTSDASFALACRIYRMLASTTSDVFSHISDEDFLRFNKAFAQYNHYVESQQFGQEAAEALVAADDIVQPLVNRRVGFPHLYKLAAYIFAERGKASDAARAASQYLIMLDNESINDDDTVHIRELAAASAIAIQDALALGLQMRKRPVQGGLSVGSSDATAGTICCTVRDDSGRRYILSAEHTLAGPAGTAVFQPGRFDGGNETDLIGEVSSAISLSRDNTNIAAGAIARLAEGVEANPGIAGIGSLQGIASTVHPGMKIKVVGRTSGLLEGQITAVDVSLKIPTPVDGGYEPTMFDQMILTTPVSRGGDSGAPVVTEDNRLVGMVYAGSSQYTVVMPIKPVLEALGVELELGQ
jgi:S1-C subfamily serine protease